MQNERENKIFTINDYQINGNIFRTYRDADGKLVFVIDETVDDIKNNVLLVINSVGNRKWDDILEHDYAVDLETVRPRKDNKYQKLDIEYDGLFVYDDLVNAYDLNENIDDAVMRLVAFRKKSVRHAAKLRMDVSTELATQSQATIDRTNENIYAFQEKLKELRSKLAEQRKQIGKEPTKQSAAKILRTESRIDALNEKIRRSKKRLSNAERRLAIALADIEAAKLVLEKTDGVDDEYKVMSENTGIIDNVAFVSDENKKQKGKQIMADDVKPLLDKDPDILDDEIAFKPVDFSNNVSDMPVSSKEINNEEIKQEADDFAPIQFDIPVKDIQESEDLQQTPVVSPLSFSGETERAVSYEKTDDSADKVVDGNIPVLDTIKSVETDDSENSVGQYDYQPQQVVESRPVVSATNVVRPVSPITGGVKNVADSGHKPTLAYYLLLFVLIVLSVFTLWLYQKQNKNNVPDLVASDVAKVETQPQILDSNTNPFDFNVVEEKVEEQPIVQQVQIVEEPEPVSVEPEPMVVEPEPVLVEPEPVQIIEEPVEMDSDILDAQEVESQPVQIIEAAAPVVSKKIPTEEEILASKPVYGVSADKDYVVESEPEIVQPSPQYLLPQQQYDAETYDNYDDNSYYDAGYDAQDGLNDTDYDDRRYPEYYDDSAEQIVTSEVFYD